MLDHAKKLEFVHKMAKLGLQHFDQGGGVITAGNSNPLSGVAGALTAQNGFNAQAPTQAGVVGGQQAKLEGILENEASGSGPNPAQIQYGQNSQQIAQRQATLNSQNRALNPALAARLSGGQAVQAEQVAAGTAAAQQAEQQLQAQQQLEGLTGQEQAGALAAQGINAQVSQNNTNSVNQEQQGLLSGLSKAIPVAGPLIGGLFGGARGGSTDNLERVVPDGKGAVKKMAVGGSISTPNAPNFSNAMVLQEQKKDMAQSNKDSGSSPGPISGVGQFLNSQPTGANNFGAGDFFSGSAPELGASEGVGGGAGAASLADLAPLAVAAAKGGLMKKGGPVKADNKKEKAAVSGDSYKNDKVPAMLSEGELVVDRDTMNDPGPAGQMARALAKHINARNRKKK